MTDPSVVGIDVFQFDSEGNVTFSQEVAIPGQSESPIAPFIPVLGPDPPGFQRALAGLDTRISPISSVSARHTARLRRELN